MRKSGRSISSERVDMLFRYCQVGTGEMDMAMDDRDAMELEIANRFLDAEYRDIGSGSCLA